MVEYIFCILIFIFLALGFTHISSKELRGFQKEVEVPVVDIRYSTGVDYSISPAGFDKSCEDTHSLLTDGTYGSRVSDYILDNPSLPRSVVPFKNLGFNTNTAIIQISNSLNILLPEERLNYTCFDINYTRYSCKYHIYTLAHILI